MRRAILGACVILAAGAPGARADYKPGIPPAVDPGTPVYAGLADPVPAEPSGPVPDGSTLERIFEADVAAGGTSYWFDRVLERPFLSNNDSYLYTRGRALYMYTHQAGTLGFANGWAYRERPTGSNQAMYTVAISGATLSEVDGRAPAVPEPLVERPHGDRPAHRPEEVHHAQQRRRDAADRDQHRHRGDDADGHRGARRWRRRRPRWAPS